MVINSININIAIILSEHTEHKKTTTYDVGTPGPDLEQVHKCGGVKHVNTFPTFRLENWISNCNSYKK